jgi:thiamine transport system permease protein
MIGHGGAPPREAGTTESVHRPRRRTVALVGTLPALFLIAFFAWPLASLVGTGLAADGGRALTRVLGDTGLLGVAWFTVWQASVSTVLTLIAALPAAYVFARYRFPGKGLARALTTVPFVLPTIVVGTAFLALVGPTGALGVDLTGTVWIILAAHVFFNMAVVIRLVGGLWAHVDPRLEESARTLGASPWRAFTRVTLPLLKPAIAAASSIVFLFSFTSFGVVLILGGPRLATLEVEIYRRAALFLDLPAAAVLAVLQLVGVVGALTAYARYQERHAVEQALRPAAETERRPSTTRERLLVTGILGWTALILATPPAVLVWKSLTVGGGFGLQAYRGLGRVTAIDPAAAVGNSLGFAAAAMLVAVGVGLPAAVVVASRRGRLSRWFDTLLMLPLGTSAVTLGLGFLIALDAPIDLRASPALIPIAHSLVAAPFVFRSTLPVLRSVQGRLRDAASTLGAGPGRAWREVDLPIMSRSAAVGAALAFVVSLGEFGATIFLARPGAPTIPIAIFRLLGRPGEINLGGALAMSVILMAITTMVVLAIERARPPGPAVF